MNSLLNLDQTIPQANDIIIPGVAHKLNGPTPQHAEFLVEHAIEEWDLFRHSCLIEITNDGLFHLGFNRRLFFAAELGETFGKSKNRFPLKADKAWVPSAEHEWGAPYALSVDHAGNLSVTHEDVCGIEIAVAEVRCKDGGLVGEKIRCHLEVLVKQTQMTSGAVLGHCGIVGFRDRMLLYPGLLAMGQRGDAVLWLHHLGKLAYKERNMIWERRHENGKSYMDRGQ